MMQGRFLSADSYVRDDFSQLYMYGTISVTDSYVHCHQQREGGKVGALTHLLPSSCLGIGKKKTCPSCLREFLFRENAFVFVCLFVCFLLLL